LRKIIIWSLVGACYLSFGSGYGRAIICSDHQGEITLEMLHSGTGRHCLTEHLHGQHQPRRTRKNRKIAQLPLENDCCATCDDFEVSLQLFAPRNEPVKTIINFIAKPLLTTASGCDLHQLSTTLSAQLPAPPSAQDPSFTYLKSTILLI
jgi:hypothetical protein